MKTRIYLQWDADPNKHILFCRKIKIYPYVENEKI